LPHRGWANNNNGEIAAVAWEVAGSDFRGAAIPAAVAIREAEAIRAAVVDIPVAVDIREAAGIPAVEDIQLAEAKGEIRMMTLAEAACVQ
jgi:hypothetical protein